MKAIRTLDFFQKISIDNVTQPTLIGSMLSLSAICLMIFLIINEISDFVKPKIKTEQIVYQDTNPNAFVKLNIEVRFNRVPCHLISVDQEDYLRNHQLNIQDTFTRLRLVKGYVKTFEYNEITLPNIISALNDTEGCHIGGYALIGKVPGNVHFSFHKYQDEYDYLNSNHTELFEKISLNHRMHLIHFGELDYKMLARFGYNFNSFNRLTDIRDFSDVKNKQEYHYYLKLIQYMFIDETTGEKFEGYQYSMTIKANEFKYGDDMAMPLVKIDYDFSPITMRVTKKARSHLHFLTHVCAIVGGVFVIFSILNRMMVTYFDFSSVN